MTNQSKTGPNYLQTTGALVSTLVLVVPGLFVGALAVWLYHFSLRWSGVDPESGLLGWIPFLKEAANAVFFHFMPELLRGVVAGAAAIGISATVFKRANWETVTFAVSSVYVAIGLLLIVALWVWQGIQITFVDVLANAVGIAIGTFSVRSSLPNPSVSDGN
jgi:hypothetical protein